MAFCSVCWSPLYTGGVGRGAFPQGQVCVCETFWRGGASTIFFKKNNFTAQYENGAQHQKVKTKAKASLHLSAPLPVCFVHTWPFTGFLTFRRLGSRPCHLECVHKCPASLFLAGLGSHVCVREGEGLVMPCFGPAWGLPAVSQLLQVLQGPLLINQLSQTIAGPRS